MIRSIICYNLQSELKKKKIKEVKAKMLLAANSIAGCFAARCLADTPNITQTGQFECFYFIGIGIVYWVQIAVLPPD